MKQMAEEAEATQGAGEAERTCECSHEAEHAECTCHYKSKPRSDELKRDLTARLNRISGQVEGVKNMIDDNRYCGDVLIQLSAIDSALRSVERIVLQNHLETCVVDEIRAGNDEIVDEAMDLIKRVSR